MKLERHIPLLLVLIMAGSAHAQTQIGSLALNPTVTTTTYYDPSTPTLTTQNAGGPVNITSSFIGYTQNQGGATPDPATDIGLHTYSASTTIYQLNRYASTTDAGAVQWSFDLSPLDTYLSANNLSASTLNLQLNNITASVLGSYQGFDVYISYTSALEGMTLTPLDTTATGNYTDFYAPGRAASVGSVVNGKFKVVAQDAGATLNDTIDLLSLYNSGVKQFDLMAVSASYGAGSQFKVPLASGIYLDTTAVPEPSSAALGILGGLGLFGVLLRRRSA